MVKQIEVDAACKRLRIAGKRPTLEAVRALLKNGGSNRDVGPMIQEWSTKNAIPDWQVDIGPSSDLLAKFDSVGAAIWEAGRNREIKAFRAERAEMERKVTEAESRMSDARSKLEEVERQLREQMAANKVLKRQLKDAGLSQRRRAEEFWDRVMRTVGEVLQKNKAQFPKDILKLLPGDLFREAAHHAERLNLGTLNKKLDMRDTWSRYVEPETDGDRKTGRWKAVDP